jgi:hypothetical protein
MHGQRYALEYASLKLDRRQAPVLQAMEMLGKAGFTAVRDVRPVHMEEGLLLAIVDGNAWLAEGTERYRLSSHPYEPCTYIALPAGGTIVIHNAFSIPAELEALAAHKGIVSITGRSWDGAGFCRVLLAAVHGGRTEYRIDEVERTAAEAMPHGFRVLSNLLRFGCGWRIFFGRRQHFAWIGDPRRNGDYVTTAEISEAEYLQIEASYPEARDAGREEGEAFRKRYVDGHPVLLQGWNKYLA